jgi:hypothetical protein
MISKNFEAVESAGTAEPFSSQREEIGAKTSANGFVAVAGGLSSTISVCL